MHGQFLQQKEKSARQNIQKLSRTVANRPYEPPGPARLHDGTVVADMDLDPTTRLSNCIVLVAVNSGATGLLARRSGRRVVVSYVGAGRSVDDVVLPGDVMHRLVMRWINEIGLERWIRNDGLELRGYIPIKAETDRMRKFRQDIRIYLGAVDFEIEITLTPEELPSSH